MLTMEKPRSDIFPFLDRVTYLCLGDVVYTGATRMMLDYFRYVKISQMTFFPFLGQLFLNNCPLNVDKVTYLCLGDVVYTGATRMMLDYFRYVKFFS